MLFVALMSSVLLNAQVDYVQHNIRVSAGGAYVHEFNSMFTPEDVEPILSSNGVRPEVGFGYRLRKSHFLFDLGISGNYTWLRNAVDDQHDEYERQDEDGFTFMGNDTWSDRNMRVHRVGIAPSLMVGFEAGRVQALAGVQLGVNVYGTEREHGDYTLKADYYKYVDQFEDMPNHGFVYEEPYKRESRATGTTMEMALCAEIDYRLTDRPAWPESIVVPHTRDYFIGLYFSYALWHTTPYAPMTIGVKFVALLEEKPKPKCVICKEY